jgi:hypothetical protein
MNRNNHAETISINYQDLVKQTAFHEAGHAAAIYLYNKSNSLPPVFFQITIKELCNNKLFAENTSASNPKQFIAKIEGGRLIQSLPGSLIQGGSYFSETEQQAYQAAYEADIVNLLVGPLSEAKYTALRDNENFNPLLINVNALKFYGGTSDLDSVDDYLNHFLDNNQERKKKLAELFKKAFIFINDQATWKAIASLASYILNNQNETISCEEAFTVLDRSVTLLTKVVNKPSIPSL